MAGKMSGIIKFLSHIPLAYVAFSALHTFTVVNKHPELKPPHYSPNILAGEGIVGIVGVLAFVWNFITWVPSFCSSGGLLALIGVGDLLFSALLFTGIGYQTTFLPLKVPACRDAATWQGRPTNQSYFSVYANIATYSDDDGHTWKISAQKTCKAAVAVFWVTVVVAILYFISGLFVIFFCCLERQPSIYGSRHSRNWSVRSLCKRIWEFTTAVPGFLGHCIFPNALRSRVCYWMRLYKKFVERRTTKKESNKTLLPTISEVSESDDPPAYDEISLNGEKKKEKTAKPDTRHESLRYHKCEEQSISKCWSCATQVCKDCSEQTLKQVTEANHHKQCCQSYCSKCFMQETCNSPRRYESCRCKPKPPQTLSTPVFAPWRTSSLLDVANTVLICRSCKELAPERLLEMREEQEASQLPGYYAQQPRVCARCGGSTMKGSARWWSCKTCHRECRSQLHPQWTERGGDAV